MSLQTQYDPKNIFAKILSGEIPSAKVYEDARILSFMDAFPQTKGHTLVIPKVKACNLFDIPSEHLQNLIAQTQKIGRAVRDALEPDGIRLMQFNGEAAGQTVFHIHFHIIPAWSEAAPRKHASGEMADINELKDLAARIKAKL
ncbi:HIT family protein [Asticcacaulis benevestitus]|uniref:HIT family hydrolase n=1 Tax=Asticcacaulis benevestitus DSM 16100 = ATCC BAA-896 TaxID=1121022 RepID=V4RRK3_9CAUL|nr:HIT family protein [Asticcacaulis benevestitus]ESQ93823.1 HIT family hydrolase [Asticcacaulis benevestitus DSM 16100 = ATCC BAA-896]